MKYTGSRFKMCSVGRNRQTILGCLGDNRGSVDMAILQQLLDDQGVGQRGCRARLGRHVLFRIFSKYAHKASGAREEIRCRRGAEQIRKRWFECARGHAHADVVSQPAARQNFWSDPPPRDISRFSMSHHTRIPPTFALCLSSSFSNVARRG